jgi:hypothetical protein
MNGKQLMYAYDMGLSKEDIVDAYEIAGHLNRLGLTYYTAYWLALNCIANLKPSERPNRARTR